MLRSALILSAGLLAGLCFACVAVAPPPAPAPPAPAPRVALAAPGVLVCDPSPFLAKAFMLAPGFMPQATGHNYRPPQSTGSIDPNGNIGKDLAKAYCLADPTIQAQLLRLTAVFINPDTCAATVCIENSWGFRERPDQSPGTGRYIALSATLWPDANSPAITYRAYENNRLGNLLAWPSNNINPPAFSPPVAGSNPSDTPEMAVLAALAHEYGHVLWYDVLKKGGNYSNLSSFCDGDFFQFWASLHYPNRWRNFQDRGKRKGKIPDLHATGIQIRDIDTAIENNHLDTASNYLSQLFATDAPWASFLGAISIDEDFVETFMLDTLTQAGFDQSTPFTLSMPIQFSDGTMADIAKDYATGAKADLSMKAACIASALPSP